MVTVLGFSFSGSGQNAGLAFVTLKDWDERKDADQLGAGARRPRLRRARRIKDAIIFPVSPPPIPELGNATGFTFRLQDRGGLGHDALLAARNQLLGMAAQEPGAGRRAPRRPGRRAAAAARHRPRQGQRARRVASPTSTARCRPRSARPTSTTSRTPAACSAWWCRPTRRRACSPTTCCSINARNSAGQAGAAVGLRQHALDHRPDADGALQRLPGDAHRRRAAPGRQHRRGDGRDGTLAAQLPAGFGFEWTGQSREEKLSGSQAPILFALLAAGGVPVPGGAVRKLVDPARR